MKTIWFRFFVKRWLKDSQFSSFFYVKLQHYQSKIAKLCRCDRWKKGSHARAHALRTHILEVISHAPLQLTLFVCGEWTNECYDNDIGRLEQCKENEVCYYKKWSVGFISSYVSYERRRCEPRDNHRINFCGKDDFWMKDEVCIMSVRLWNFKDGGS